MVDEINKPAQFESEPFSEEVWQVRQLENPLIARALNRDITKEFLAMLRFKIDHLELININCVGQVRCQPAGSKVLMADGRWKFVEEIKIGDQVISPQADGSVTYESVRRLHSDFRQIYDIKQRLRSSKVIFRCSDNHSVIHLMKSVRHNRWINQEKTAEELSLLKHNTMQRYFLLTTPEIKAFKGRKNPEVNPYALGLFLGNGCASASGNLGIVVRRRSVVDRLAGEIPLIRMAREKNYFRAVISSAGQFAKSLKAFGLWAVPSHMRFIPDSCMLADADFRRKLLAGLMDSDGYVVPSGSVQFSGTSIRLVQQVVDLVFSLGGYANVFRVVQNLEKEWRNCYVLSLNFKHWSIPMSDEFRQSRIRKERRIEPRKVSFVSVPSGVKEKVFGFEITGQSQCFVGDGYSVIHNSGKSYAMFALATIIGNYTKIPFDSKHVLKRQSDYVQVFKEGKPNELFVIDEYEVGEFGIGSNAEIYQEVDLARIAAKRILHKINLCGEETGISTNAGYQLVPMGRDFENFQTKLLVYKLERGQEIPMGFIVIPLKPVLCDEMILHRVKGCLQCPLYNTDGCQRDFPKNYEKEKDENIKRITQQNFNWRAKLRIEVAEELSKNAQFAGLKKKERIIYARNLIPRYTNRVLTEKEIEEIVVIASMASENPELLAEIKGAQPKLIPLEDADEDGASVDEGAADGAVEDAE